MTDHINIKLAVADAHRVLDVAIYETVARDRAETAAMTGMGSSDWRRIRHAIEAALAEELEGKA